MNATTDLAIPEAAPSDYCRRNEIAYLALFGSAGRGELGAQSDVDLLQFGGLLLVIKRGVQLISFPNPAMTTAARANLGIAAAVLRIQKPAGRVGFAGRYPAWRGQCSLALATI